MTRYIPGTYVRDPQERATRLAYARDWHVLMKPHFDALYGPRRCLGPICLGEN